MRKPTTWICLGAGGGLLWLTGGSQEKLGALAWVLFWLAVIVLALRD